MKAFPDTATLDLYWPVSRAGEAIEALARRAKLFPLDAEIPVPPAGIACNGTRSERWIEDAAARLGIEAEPAEAPYPEAERLRRGAAPALLRLPGVGEARFLALAGRRGGDLLLLAPDGEFHR